MKRIGLDAVVAAQANLAGQSHPRAVGNFPGLLVLKHGDVKVGEWTRVPPSEFVRLCDKWFRIEGAPLGARPYFYPIRGWRHRNWPLGDVFTRFKDTSPLASQGFLESRGEHDEWEWRLMEGYEGVLPKYVGDELLPALDFAVWIYRDEEWPDNAEAGDVSARFLADFRLTDQERRLLFTNESSLDPDGLFEAPWEKGALVARLPSPTAPTAPAQTLTVVGEEEPIEYDLDALVEDLQVEADIVNLWLASIERKGQAVFYGPPGTGKTYAAECVAKYLAAKGDGFYKTLQFHPSYAYEDFIQGIRPDLDGMELTYEKHNGQFVNFCDEARRHTGTCVIVLDEMNRANLSRVFGELMFGLEYREVPVPLAIGDTFAVPHNVRVLGTMNTADRSIALVDHALRRRFAFLAVRPNFEILDRYHQTTGFDPSGLESVLTKVNAAIGDENYSIGVSFFLLRDIEKQIEAVWTTEIVPYLEEYFFDQPARARMFAWEHVAAEILG